MEFKKKLKDAKSMNAIKNVESLQIQKMEKREKG
jgi:hypothetical protein